MRAETLEPVVERRVRPQGGLDRHRRHDVGGADQRRQPLDRERSDREHPLGAVHQGEPFLRLQRERGESGALHRSRRGLGAGIRQHLARADHRQREVGQRTQVPGGAERSLLRHRGDHVGVQHLHHQVHELGSHARVA
jgi:hypothetical protein